MKKFVSRIFLCYFMMFASFCCSSLERQTKAMSKVSYAIRDSMEIGRFDLADEYSKELIRLAIPPTPEERAIIHPFTEGK